MKHIFFFILLCLFLLLSCSCSQSRYNHVPRYHERHNTGGGLSVKEKEQAIKASGYIAADAAHIPGIKPDLKPVKETRVLKRPAEAKTSPARRANKVVYTAQRMAAKDRVFNYIAPTAAYNISQDDPDEKHCCGLIILTLVLYLIVFVLARYLFEVGISFGVFLLGLLALIILLLILKYATGIGR